jgi:hypothetical protein
VIFVRLASAQAMKGVLGRQQWHFPAGWDKVIKAELSNTK